MANNKEKPSKESGWEKGARLYRNVNGLGAAAIAGAALLIPGPNVIIASWAGWNAAQAGGGELARLYAKKARKKKDSKK